MKSWIKALVLVALPVLAAVLLVVAAEKFGGRESSESLKQLDNSVRKAVMTCYATEGVYPPNVEYLEKRYGVQIDHEKYSVFYEVFGSNIMPQITVLELSEEDS